MPWSLDQRRKFLRNLDAVDTKVRTFYKYFLYVLIVTVTIFAFFLHRSFVRDASHDYLDFYFGILFFLFLAWAASQLFALRARANINAESLLEKPAAPKFDLKLDRDQETGARTFSFHFGSGPPPSPSEGVSFGLNLSSLSDEDKPDEAALIQADAYLNEGSSLDFVCRMINPRYKDWSSPQQQIYRAHLKGALELWRARKARTPDPPNA